MQAEVPRMTRLLPPAYFFAAIVLMLALHFLVPGASLISFPWRLLGILPVAAGIALNIDADRQFKALKTTVKPFQESSALATNRSFRLSRNPMYLGMILIVSGIAVFMGSASPWIVVAGLAVVLDRVFIVREERMLDETFGAAFRDYEQRVRRWL